MFAKLLKYEWRSNANTFWILSAAAIGVSVLGGVLLRQLFAGGNDLTGTAAFTMASLLFFILLSLIGYVAAVEIMLLTRFYKNKFTDEGYLTFTLPVNVHQIFLSSAANMLLWMLISSIVLMLGLTILFGIALTGLPTEILELIQSEIALIGPEITNDYWALDLISRIVAMVFGVLMPMTCLTVGAVVAKKHKILAAFGIYYIISMIINTMESVMLLATSFSDAIYSEEAYADLLVESTVVSIIVQLVIIAAGYFLSTGLMKRKLNLN